MAGQKGKEILIKRYDGAGYVSIGGLRTKGLRINGAPAADVSDSDSPGWRELLAGAGLKSCSLQGGGVFKDSAAENSVRADLLADVASNYQFIFPGGFTAQGPFVVQSADYSGDYQGEATYSFSFESSGEIAFT